MSDRILEELRHICARQMAPKEGDLLEFNGAADHLQLPIELPPKVSFSAAVTSINASRARAKDEAH